jgi:signal transduction histidine kinase
MVKLASGEVAGLNTSAARLFAIDPLRAFRQGPPEGGVACAPKEWARLTATIRDTGLVRDFPLTFHGGQHGTVQVLGSGEILPIEGTGYVHLAEAETVLFRKKRMEVLGELASGIAHDFNNVLCVLMATLGLAEAEAGDPAAVSHRLADAVNECKRARELIRQILTFGRQQQPEQQTLRLQPVVAEAIRMVGCGLPSQVLLEAQIDPLAPPVVANACQIQQVLLNLAINAVHAMKDRGGRLAIRLDTTQLEQPQFEGYAGLQPGRFLRLTVSDTGHGMKAETMKRIFEPSFTTKPPGEGSGLGLAVVQRIVQSHGGAVAVQSTEGSGTVFTVYLPTARTAAAERRRGGGLSADDLGPARHCA